jgi:hypothetical protein
MGYRMTNPLFAHLDLETMSDCDRRCPTCLRNSHPNREVVAPWFKQNYMSMKMIRKILDQADEMEFRGSVCLSHYNEPLMDSRLPEIAKIAHTRFYTYFNTNGDFLTEDLAHQLDGNVDKIIVSLYMDEPIKSKRAEWIKTLFHKTEAVVNTVSDHMVTHFSPRPELKSLIEQNIGNRCLEPQLHCIINHRGQYLLCCDDMIGNFGLGSFPEIGLEDYWFGDKHMSIYNALKQQGGRRLFPYCTSCPRG